LGSRILSIADAYDAIVSDRVYRKGRPREDAFAELRRCAGMQFDPAIVDRFIAVISSRGEQNVANEIARHNEDWTHLSKEAGRLGEAVDANDIESVTAVADHLKQVALKLEIPSVAELAAKILQASDVEQDAAELLTLTHEMLELCASAQGRIILQAEANASTAR
jgi:hypothetical protein